MQPNVRITHRRISVGKVLESVVDRRAGGTVMFLGTVRDRSEGKRVAGLVYEAYREMAEKRMAEIAQEIETRWGIRRLTMVHRVGNLGVGEVSVAVAVSCEHRAEAFEACRYGIDAIKRTLPLWKKEVSRRGAGAWVKGTPIGKR